jgi:integrase
MTLTFEPWNPKGERPVARKQGDSNAAAAPAYGEHDVFTVPDGGPDGKGGRKQKWHTFQHGLTLMVCGNSRLWYSPWEVPKHMLKAGRPRNVKRESLGSAHKVSYANALSAHLKIQGDIGDGKYPTASSAKGPGRRPKGGTFETYAIPLVAGWAAKRKHPKDAQGMKNIIPRHCTAINALPLAKIGTPEVLDVLRPIWDAKPAMAEAVRYLIARVLKAAARENLRPNDQPASAEAIIDVLGKPTKRPGFIRGPMKSVPVLDMPDFMAELRATVAQTPRAVELLVLSNLRTNPVRFLRRSHLLITTAEIAKHKSLHHDGPRWIVPAALMKVDDTGHDFVLPLSPRAVAVIEQQIAYLEDLCGGGRAVDLLFPGDVSRDQPISENTMRDWVKWTLKKDATPHGFRAAFQTWAENELQEDGETMKFNPDAIGYSMAHNPGDKVKQAYRRNRLWKPRVGIMNAWARYLGPTKATLEAVA